VSGSALPDPFLATAIRTSRPPHDGESLAGYLLALDEMNLLDAGRVLRLVRRVDAGPRKVGRPGFFVNASTINLAALAPLAGGVSVTELEKLTAVPALRWLFGAANKVVRPTKLGWRLCPACVRQRRLPLVSLFADIDGCIEHERVLVDRCRAGCEAPIELFMGQDLPFTCHDIGCAHPYEDLDARRLTAAEVTGLRHRAAIYEDLFAFAATAPAPVPSMRILANALHGLIAASGSAESLRIRVGSRPSLALVVEVLAATSSSAHDLDARLRAVTTPVAPRPQPGPSGCPNPRCQANLDKAKARGLLRCANESQCRTCGTRFTRERILFSYDEQPGYRPVFALRNSVRLERHRQRLRVLCDRWLQDDRTITREAALRDAGIRPSIIPHLSDRAGFCAIVENAQDRQRERRIEHQRAQAALIGDAELRRRMELLGLAHAIGVAKACQQAGVHRSRYYIWKAAFERGGLEGLRATCVKRPRSRP
jgi:hypothetical protein